LESAAALAREGFAVSYLPVEPSGLLSLETLAAAITDRTLLVSVMAAHNEIGVIQPLAEIGALCRSRGVLFHTDAAQAFGKIPLDVEAMRIDLMSISGHKTYGPKGIGALYIRRRRAPPAGEPQLRLPRDHRAGADRGLPEHCDIHRLGLHLGERRAVLRAARARCVGGTGERLDPPWSRPVHHCGGGRFRGRCA